MLVTDSDSWVVHRAVDAERFADGVTVKAFVLADLQDGGEAAGFVSGSEAVLVDVTDKRHIAWISERGLPGRPGTAVYALRESADDGALMREGWVFDRASDGYFNNLTEANAANGVRRILGLGVAPGLEYGPPEELLSLGVYHPDAPSKFPEADGYMEWYRTRPGYSEGKPWLGVMLFEAFLDRGQRPAADALVRLLEDEGFNVMPAFGDNLPVVERIFLDPGGKGRVDAVAALTLKFFLATDERLREALRVLDVPVVNSMYLEAQTIAQWRESPRGIPTDEVLWNLANPEISGAIEPSLGIGKTEGLTARGAREYRWEVLEAEARHMARRIARHVALARKPAAEKRIAILYYNDARGRQSVEATYLNVFRSLADIAARLKEEGYSVDSDPPLDEERVKSLVLRGGRNVGSWAPGELDTLIGSGTAVLWPVAEYRELFDGLPEEFRENVLAQWGPPEEAVLMARDGKLVLPAVVRGNLLIMPQGARAAGDDPVRLYHDPTIFPHHQYIAAYLWLEHVWKADAVVHLGTHGTLEWLPGKQSGMSLSDPPEVLLGTLPDVYPYNMDVLAEGIQAKRRARAVLIDHLVPPLVRAGKYREYAELARLIASYRSAAATDSATAGEHLARIGELASRLGLERDLHLGPFAGPEDVPALSEYLERMDGADVPYGLHTFGTSPAGGARDSLLDLIARDNPGIDRDEYRAKLDASGPNEMTSLLKGLGGRYVEPGEGNDPARNPAALPSGRNFYGLSPARIPTREAWRLGREAADGIIGDYVRDHGEYPDKAAVIIWALETMRNEGVNESTVLALIGVEPTWAPSGIVTGTRPVPGRVLGRPRVDVTIDSSGLYRDLFPDRIVFLDGAIRQASLQDDVENVIAVNDESNRLALIARGYPADHARRLSLARIFSERPGNYGNRVPEIVSASGTWDDPEDAALAFREHTGYAYGADLWGEPARDSLELNLTGSKIAWHSVSSHLFGILEDEDFNGYLGGLAMAIASLSGGAAPATLVTDQRSPGKVIMTGLDALVGFDARTRYLNPTWIEGMKAEGYAGAVEMARFVEVLFAFNVTVPQAVDTKLWDQAYEVFVGDGYGDGVAGFMDESSPWAFQSLTGRMLETVRKGYWAPPDAVRHKLATAYAASVVERGVACSDLVCNNPQLNRMVLDIVSLPGAAAPGLAERFREAVERAAGKPLDEQVADSLRTIGELAARRAELDSNPPVAQPLRGPEAQVLPGPGAEADAASGAESVRGLRMENLTRSAGDSSLSPSGIEWTLSIFGLALLAVFFIGYRMRASRAERAGASPGNAASDGDA
ncbi:MAG: cobaltochelatase subunit CobN [Deltaproteobacteria bacterium]|jgi:cobaltochelatase CobN|nr:cobaltochelatase subunit CobN [Deltaproteobacteria bacterium]